MGERYGRILSGCRYACRTAVGIPWLVSPQWRYNNDNNKLLANTDVTVTSELTANSCKLRSRQLFFSCLNLELGGRYGGVTITRPNLRRYLRRFSPAVSFENALSRWAQNWQLNNRTHGRHTYYDFSDHAEHLNSGRKIVFFLFFVNGLE